MKRLFLGLLVAGVAMAGSAFTNANNAKLTTAYITSESGASPNIVYTYDQNSSRTCEANVKPCKLTAVDYDFQSSGTITQAELNDQDVVHIDSRQGSSY